MNPSVFECHHVCTRGLRFYLPHAFPIPPHTSSVHSGESELHEASNVGSVPQAQENSCRVTSSPATGMNVPRFCRHLGRFFQDNVRVSSTRLTSSSHSSIDPLRITIDGSISDDGRRSARTQRSIPKSIVRNCTMVSTYRRYMSYA